MDWFREIPVGQYVSGDRSWLRKVDPRVKLGWVLMFLLTPILAGTLWRLGLFLSLLAITFLSFLPRRVWWRSLLLLLLFSLLLGGIAMLLPASEASSFLDVRSPQELPGIDIESAPWEILNVPVHVGKITLGSLVVDRRSFQLGMKTFTLIFTVIHSVNLMLITTSPERLVWSLRRLMSPLALLGIPVDRMSFQILLALRFLPLVQEEIQNLFRALAVRAINIKRLGIKQFIGLSLSVCERFITNILLRSEQGAEALLARDVKLYPFEHFSEESNTQDGNFCINIGASLLLFLVLILRGKYGGL